MSDSGLRVGGKTYKKSSDLPIKYRAQWEAGSRQRDPGNVDPRYAPNVGRTIVPHVTTFSGIVSTLAKTYRNHDEAIRHDVRNANMMRRDPMIMGPLLSRQRAVALLNWSIEPEDRNSQVQVRIAKEIQQMISMIPNFTEYRRNLLDAVWYGRYGVQHKWGFVKRGGTRGRGVVGWVPVNGDKLLFRYDDGTGKYDHEEIGIKVSPAHVKNDIWAGKPELEYNTEGSGVFLRGWERSRLAVHKHLVMDGDYEDPTTGGMINGVGLRHFLYWAWFQKQETLAQLAEVVERTGMGFTIYYYPAGNDQAREKVEEVAEDQAHKNQIIMPYDPANPNAYGIDQVQPQTAGIPALMELIDNYWGNWIIRFILGQTLSMRSDSTGLGSGLSDLHKESFLQIVEYDAASLDETLTKDLVRMYVMFNYPSYRNVNFRFRSHTEKSVPLEKLQSIQAAWSMGAKVKASDVMDLVGMTVAGEDDDALYNPQLAASLQQFKAQIDSQREQDVQAELAQQKSKASNYAQLFQKKLAYKKSAGDWEVVKSDDRTHVYSPSLKIGGYVDALDGERPVFVVTHGDEYKAKDYELEIIDYAKKGPKVVRRPKRMTPFHGEYGGSVKGVHETTFTGKKPQDLVIKKPVPAKPQGDKTRNSKVEQYANEGIDLGEWWLQDGSAAFADSYNGDSHESIASASYRNDIHDALGEDPDVAEWTPEHRQRALDAGFSPLHVDLAEGVGDEDPRFHAAKDFGWTRMQGNNLETYGLDRSKLKSIALDLDRAVDHEDFDWDRATWNIYDHKTGKNYTGVPTDVLNSGDMKSLRDSQQYSKDGAGPGDHAEEDFDMTFKQVTGYLDGLRGDMPEEAYGTAGAASTQGLMPRDPGSKENQDYKEPLRYQSDKSYEESFDGILLDKTPDQYADDVDEESKVDLSPQEGIENIEGPTPAELELVETDESTGEFDPESAPAVIVSKPGRDVEPEASTEAEEEGSLESIAKKHGVNLPAEDSSKALTEIGDLQKEEEKEGELKGKKVEIERFEFDPDMSLARIGYLDSLDQLGMGSSSTDLERDLSQTELGVYKLVGNFRMLKNVKDKWFNDERTKGLEWNYKNLDYIATKTNDADYRSGAGFFKSFEGDKDRKTGIVNTLTNDQIKMASELARVDYSDGTQKGYFSHLKSKGIGSGVADEIVADFKERAASRNKGKKALSPEEIEARFGDLVDPVKVGNSMRQDVFREAFEWRQAKKELRRFEGLPNVPDEEREKLVKVLKEDADYWEGEYKASLREIKKHVKNNESLKDLFGPYERSLAAYVAGTRKNRPKKPGEKVEKTGDVVGDVQDIVEEQTAEAPEPFDVSRVEAMSNEQLVDAAKDPGLDQEAQQAVSEALESRKKAAEQGQTKADEKKPAEPKKDIGEFYTPDEVSDLVGKMTTYQQLNEIAVGNGIDLSGLGKKATIDDVRQAVLFDEDGNQRDIKIARPKKQELPPEPAPKEEPEKEEAPAAEATEPVEAETPAEPQVEPAPAAEVKPEPKTEPAAEKPVEPLPSKAEPAIDLSNMKSAVMSASDSIGKTLTDADYEERGFGSIIGDLAKASAFKELLKADAKLKAAYDAKGVDLNLDQRRKFLRDYLSSSTAVEGEEPYDPNKELQETEGMEAPPITELAEPPESANRELQGIANEIKQKDAGNVVPRLSQRARELANDGLDSAIQESIDSRDDGTTAADFDSQIKDLDELVDEYESRLEKVSADTLMEHAFEVFLGDAKDSEDPSVLAIKSHLMSMPKDALMGALVDIRGEQLANKLAEIEASKWDEALKATGAGDVSEIDGDSKTVDMVNRMFGFALEKDIDTSPPDTGDTVKKMPGAPPVPEDVLEKRKKDAEEKKVEAERKKAWDRMYSDYTKWIDSRGLLGEVFGADAVRDSQNKSIRDLTDEVMQQMDMDVMSAATALGWDATEIKGKDIGDQLEKQANAAWNFVQERKAEMDESIESFTGFYHSLDPEKKAEFYKAVRTTPEKMDKWADLPLRERATISSRAMMHYAQAGGFVPDAKASTTENFKAAVDYIDNNRKQVEDRVKELYGKKPDLSPKMNTKALIGVFMLLLMISLLSAANRNL